MKSEKLIIGIVVSLALGLLTILWFFGHIALAFFFAFQGWKMFV